MITSSTDSSSHLADTVLVLSVFFIIILTLSSKQQYHSNFTGEKTEVKKRGQITGIGHITELTRELGLPDSRSWALSSQETTGSTLKSFYSKVSDIKFSPQVKIYCTYNSFYILSWSYIITTVLIYN